MTAVVKLAGIVAIRTADGVEHPLHDRRGRIALVRLVLDRRYGTSRDRLADAVWPERLPASWESALRTVVSSVRAFVVGVLTADEARLVMESGRYILRLPPNLVVDLEQAEGEVQTAEKALAVGDALAAGKLSVSAMRNLRLPVLADYDSEWINELRERRLELAIVTLEVMSSAASQLGRTAAALAAANEAVSLAPLRESAHRCRMVAHARAGNAAEAFRSYERLRQALIEELGVGPDPETERLYRGLLARS